MDFRSLEKKGATTCLNDGNEKKLGKAMRFGHCSARVGGGVAERRLVEEDGGRSTCKRRFRTFVGPYVALLSAAIFASRRAMRSSFRDGIPPRA